MEHRAFHYATLQAELKTLDCALPLAEDLSVLAQPLNVGEITLKNRLAIQPMEGCDGTADGAPGELTRRRYHRFAASGAALIWEEATSVVPAGTMLTSRVNLYDGFPYPYGFGVNPGEGIKPDLTEAKRLVSMLHEKFGMPLLDMTIGNPYVNPHVNRPYDKGGYIPKEHPLEGVTRMVNCITEVKKAFPPLAVISSGHSYLRQFAPHLAAGQILAGGTDMAGFGREAFAYPTFARDILHDGTMDAKKCCLACGKCTELMRAGSTAGVQGIGL